MTDDATGIPPAARWLGLAGLLPQAAALVAVTAGEPEGRFTALALAFAYAALILSFLGGTWWGLAAHARNTAPRWIWVAAVTPSLLALACTVPWAVGAAWPGPSLAVLGIAILAAPIVDFRLSRLGLAPRWWNGMRATLSTGLGLMTLAIAYFA